MNEKQLVIIARTLSIVFTPFYLPLVGMLALFLFSYLAVLPLMYKMQVLVITYLFTILLPNICIHWYRRYNGWTLWHLREKDKRMVPYTISIISYLCCFTLMKYLHMPHFMSAIIVAALFVQVMCAIINIWFKISTHMAAIGGVTGGVIAFSFIFGFNPIWWLSVLIILSGLVGTARMIMRIHTLSEICAGYILGFITTFLAVILI